MEVYGYSYKMAAHLLVTGEDAGDFLQSQFSNDLRPLSAGESIYGLWLDVKGKIVADGWVLCEGDEQFRIFSAASPGETIQSKLEQHIIADDVGIGPVDQLEALAVIGDGERALAAETGGRSFCLPGRRSDRRSRELIFPDSASRGEWLKSSGIETVSEDWIQEERLKAGIASLGCEVLPGDMPGEAGLVEEAVSLTKGCFLGQEVVARMYNVGRPQRALYRLSGIGGVPPLPSPLSSTEGKALGELRVAVAIPSGWHGVAMLKSRFVEPGMRLCCGDGTTELTGSYGGKKGDGAD
jgi:folate-binding protein YgfZ